SCMAATAWERRSASRATRATGCPSRPKRRATASEIPGPCPHTSSVAFMGGILRGRLMRRKDPGRFGLLGLGGPWILGRQKLRRECNPAVHRTYACVGPLHDSVVTHPHHACGGPQGWDGFEQVEGTA